MENQFSILTIPGPENITKVKKDPPVGWPLSLYLRRFVTEHKQYERYNI